MSIVRVAHASQSVLQFSPVRENPTLPTRSQVSTPQDSDTRMFITPEEKVQILDEHIYELRNLVAELIDQDAYPDEDMRDYVAELRYSREKRDEIIHLMRELSRLQITGHPPCDYEEWIPWAYEQMRPRAPQGIPEPEYDWSDRLRWAQSKRTLVRIAPAAPKAAHAPTVASGSKPPRKSPTRFWSLKIALRRFWVAISVTRSR